MRKLLVKNYGSVEKSASNNFKERIGNKQTKALLSELKTGIKQSTETKQKISKKLKGRPASENLKQVMRDNNPSMHHIKAICPHCGKTGSHVIMKRWHFDRCKNA